MSRKIRRKTVVPKLSEAEWNFVAPAYQHKDMEVPLDSDLRELMACPICKESYDDPRRRPKIVQIRICGHRLCEDCYDGLFTGRFGEAAMAEYGKKVEVFCPECKELLNQKNDKQIDDDASAFMWMLQAECKSKQRAAGEEK